MKASGRSSSLIFVWSASWELFAVALPRQTNPAASTSCFSQTCVWRILARRAFVTARSLDTLVRARVKKKSAERRVVAAVAYEGRRARAARRARETGALSQFFRRVSTDAGDVPRPQWPTRRAAELVLIRSSSFLRLLVCCDKMFSSDEHRASITSMLTTLTRARTKRVLRA